MYQDTVDYDMGFIQRGEVKIQLVTLGEGYSGDYNPENPDDEELLRFDVIHREETLCSYCTAMPVNITNEQKEEMLNILMNALYNAIMCGYGNEVDKIAQRMSWINPEWLEKMK